MTGRPVGCRGSVRASHRLPPVWQAVPIALLLAVAGAIPVLADGGLPEIANLDAGPFTATLHNDAPTLMTGSNTLTLEIPALPDRHAVSLSLAGPRGERLDVPLRPLQVLDGPSDAHSVGHGDTHAAAQTDAASGRAVSGMDHAAPGTSHDMPGMAHDMGAMGQAAPGDGQQVEPLHDASSGPPAGGVTHRARGSVSVPESGTWRARLVIRKDAGASFVAEATLKAEDSGPNAFYLAGTGLLISGFLLYGATQRRRHAAVPRTAR